jgi:hypothetical protein
VSVKLTNLEHSTLNHSRLVVQTHRWCSIRQQRSAQCPSGRGEKSNIHLESGVTSILAHAPKGNKRSVCDPHTGYLILCALTGLPCGFNSSHRREIQTINKHSSAKKRLTHTHYLHAHTHISTHLNTPAHIHECSTSGRASQRGKRQCIQHLQVQAAWTRGGGARKSHSGGVCVCVSVCLNTHVYTY